MLLMGVQNIDTLSTDINCKYKYIQIEYKRNVVVYICNIKMII